MSQLLALILAGIIISIIVKYAKFRAEQRLRENPPERKVIEISLPRGEANSADRMARVLRAIASAAMGDAKARKAGMRQIDLVYMFEVPRNSMEAVGRFLLYCDPDKIDMVKRAIRQTYGRVASIKAISADEDPMAQIARALRPPAPADHADAGEQDPEPEHDPALEPDQAHTFQAGENAAAHIGSSARSQLTETTADAT